MSVKVNLSIKEIYAASCPECKQKLAAMLKEKVSDKAVIEALESDDN